MTGPAHLTLAVRVGRGPRLRAVVRGGFASVKRKPAENRPAAGVLRAEQIA
jgi:hypothetical protein